jgi:hypothetical protein
MHIFCYSQIILFAGKILVTGGTPVCDKGVVEVIELIDSSKENIVYEDKSMARFGVIGGLLQNQLLVGGGFNSMLGGLFKIAKSLDESISSMTSTTPLSQTGVPPVTKILPANKII